MLAASRAEAKHRNYRTPDSDSLQFSLCLRSPPYDARNPLYCICLSVNPEVGLKPSNFRNPVYSGLGLVALNHTPNPPKLPVRGLETFIPISIALAD